MLLSFIGVALLYSITLLGLYLWNDDLPTSYGKTKPNEMMKSLLLLFVTALTLYSCKLNKKIETLKEFETLETEMAELRDDSQPEIEVSKKDSAEFLKFWDKFYQSYKQNDTNSLIRLSLDSVKSPVNIEDFTKTEIQTEQLSISDFINAPFRKKAAVEFVPYSMNLPFLIYYRYIYNTDSLNIKLKKDSALLTYKIFADTKEIRGNYEIHRLYAFSFIRKNNKIRFTGLEIGDRNSDFLNDSITMSKLYFPLYRETQSRQMNLNALDTFSNLWYSTYLSDFKEPNLYTDSGSDDIYRFTWLRSFHKPVIIRFQKHRNDYILTTKEMTDNRGYIPNEFIVNTSQNLSSIKWDQFEFKLGRINFWNMATLDPEPGAMDGAQWILEAKVGGRYHFVNRMFGINFKECCKYLLQLSKLKIREEDIY